MTVVSTHYLQNKVFMKPTWNGSSEQTEVSKFYLHDLIAHSHWTEASCILGDVYQHFSEDYNVEFIAVIDEGKLIGMCSRSGIAMLLGSLYGRSLFSKRQVRDYMVTPHLAVRTSDPLPEVLRWASSRIEERFYDDVILVDPMGNYLGMIHMKTLVQLQNHFFIKNIAQLEQQRSEIDQKNKQMEENLRLANQLQQAIMPQSYPCFPPDVQAENSLLKFSHFYQSADLLGGDFFHVSQLSDHEAGVFICDVMGHGVSAALVTSMIRALIERYRTVKHEPSDLLTDINERLLAMLGSKQQMFATAAYMIVDVESHQLRAACAGHHPPVMMNRHTCKVETLRFGQVAGPPVGIVKDAAYENLSFPVFEGDVLIAFTDGLIEVFNHEEQQFGKNRLINLLEKHGTLPIPQLFKTLMEQISFFSSGVFDDDVCLVGVEICG
ncbi:MAG: SpoIIE family protein phosphatase [SAR324 cluster bacterium]|nr:SpoIIE family protein phosphatase [SAR324 cluster bacterium]